jgi:hypothetical protein
MEREAEHAGEHREHADGEQDRQPAAAGRRLRIAPGPETNQRQDERRDAECLERQEVDDEAAGEAEDCSRHGPAEQTERDHCDEQKIGRAATHGERGKDRRLKQRRGENDSGDADGEAGCHRGRFSGMSTRTASSPSKSTYGST